MKFIPYLIVYKETLPLPKRETQKSFSWDLLNELLKSYYLNVLQQMLRAPTLLTNIFANTRKNYYSRETHGYIELNYNMDKVPYFIRLKWRLQELWRKLLRIGR